MVELFANSEDPDQMPLSAASDLGLHCLPVTCLGVSSLQWVKYSDTVNPYHNYHKMCVSPFYYKMICQMPHFVASDLVLHYLCRSVRLKT